MRRPDRQPGLVLGVELRQQSPIALEDGPFGGVSRGGLGVVDALLGGRPVVQPLAEPSTVAGPGHKISDGAKPTLGFDLADRLVEGRGGRGLREQGGAVANRRRHPPPEVGPRADPRLAVTGL